MRSNSAVDAQLALCRVLDTLYLFASQCASRLHNCCFRSRASSPPQHEDASRTHVIPDRQAALFCTCQAVLVYNFSPLCTTCLTEMLVADGRRFALHLHCDPSLPLTLLFTAKSQASPAMCPWRRIRGAMRRSRALEGHGQPKTTTSISCIASYGVCVYVSCLLGLVLSLALTLEHIVPICTEYKRS